MRLFYLQLSNAFFLLYRLRYDLVTVLEIGYNLVVLYLFNYLRYDYITY